MSFQLYVQAFANGDPAGFRREILYLAFGRVLIELEEDYWQVDYGERGRCDLFLGFLPSDVSLIHSVSIDHYVADSRLWGAIWTLLAQPGTVFHFPGTDAALARDPAVANALPATLIQALGKPLIISDYRAIARSIKED